jgi:O-antigen/teichoic acid export membrane protein
MFSFGGRLLLTSIISVIWNEIYSFIIGKSYSAAILGQYSRAEKFKSMVTSNISIVMQRVTYPVLSSIREDKERQLRVFRKLFRTTVLISFTAVLGLAAASESIVITLVGEKWIPSIEYLQIL